MAFAPLLIIQPQRLSRNPTSRVKTIEYKPPKMKPMSQTSNGENMLKDALLVENHAINEPLFLSWIKEVHETLPIDHQFPERVFAKIKCIAPYLHQLSEEGKEKACLLPAMYVLQRHRLQILMLPDFFKIAYPIKTASTLHSELLNQHRIPSELKCLIYKFTYKLFHLLKIFVLNDIPISEQIFIDRLLNLVHDYSIEEYQKGFSARAKGIKDNFINLMQDNEKNLKALSFFGKEKICAIFHAVVKSQSWILLQNIKHFDGFKALIWELKDTPNGKIVFNCERQTGGYISRGYISYGSSNDYY